MTIAHEITCISKSERHSTHERITHVGGKSGAKEGGGPWRISQEEAIKGIEERVWAFFVTKNGSKVNVIVSTSRYGNKYLKTTADGEYPNNLLSLPECP